MASFLSRALVSASINVPMTQIVGFPVGPVPSALGLGLYMANAEAPGLYDYDQYGYVRPGANRPPVSAEEQAWIDRYNQERRALTESQRDALDDFLERTAGVARRPKPIAEQCNRDWRQALQPPPRDPLAIDLDGDGIETTPVLVGGTPTLFDHDADGIRTGTGWLHPDDAWLVRDINGNGTIDSGRELFGVDTLITTTQLVGGVPQTVTRTASNGFEALKALDTGNGTAGSTGHGDNVFNANDAEFANLRVWRDLNGDGISQATELQTLAAAGIASISLNHTTTNTNLGNGNTLTGTATVTRTSGSTTSVGGVGLSAGNIDLANNPFYREFPDTVPLSAEARALPDMGGSGWLRDLREAASLPTAQGLALTAALQDIAAAGTRTAQRSAVHGLLEAWSGTSGNLNPWSIAFSSGASQELAVSIGISVVAETDQSITYRFEADGKTVWAAGTQGNYVAVNFQSSLYYTDVSLPDGTTQRTLTGEGRQILYRLGVLEAFNGSRFVDFQRTSPKSSGGSGSSGGRGGGAAPDWSQMGTISISDLQAERLHQSYEALVESVYPALALQTRLRPYLDEVDLVIDENGVAFDTTALAARLASGYASDATVATQDLIELVRFAQPTLHAVGFDAISQIRSWVESWPTGSPLFAVASEAGLNYTPSTAGTAVSDFIIGDVNGNALGGGEGNDVIDGGGGADTITGGNGDDWLYGGAGNDILNGEAGNDILDGGAGNDTLNGGVGNNTYRFGRGDGADWISYSPNDLTAGKLNTLQLKADVTPADLVLRQVYSPNFGGNTALEVGIAGTTDKIVIDGFFQADNPMGGYNPVQQFSFDDGTVWNLASIQAALFAGTAAADVIYGATAADAISGGAGNDTLYGRTGDDTLIGGEGNDILFGEAGNDTLDGGAGNDTLGGGLGNNTYRFGRGDGADWISYSPNDLTVGKLNTLQFKTDVAPADLVLRQVYSPNFGGNTALEVAIAGTTDKIVIDGFFQADNPMGGYNPVQQFSFDDGTVWNLASIQAALFAGTAVADVIYGTPVADAISGGDGNDTLYGRNGDDLLSGGAGNDILYGEAGNDILDGGAGNDTLNGGLGNNTYRFGRGDGADWISYSLNDLTAGRLNTLQLKADVAPADLMLRQVYSPNFGGNTALEVAIAGTTDKIVIDGFFQADNPMSSYNPVQQFSFDDGTVWNLASIQAALFAGTAVADVIYGTPVADAISGGDGNDTMYGRAGDDTLMGGEGNDTLYGEAGNDILDGGAGNDTLNGGVGNNTYRFGRGDGADHITGSQNDATVGKLNTLALKSGVDPADLVLRQVYSSYWGGNTALEVAIAGTTDKITIDGFFRSDNPAQSYNPVQQFSFADGTVWNLADIQAALFSGTSGNDALYGTIASESISGGLGNDTLFGRTGDDTLMGGEGNDILYGEAGNDILDGGAGNDTLDGGLGNNTYRFGRGDGSDHIAGSQNDATAGKLNTLALKSGVVPSDLVLRKAYSSYWGGNAALEVAIAGTTDKITIDGFFRSDNPAQSYNPVQQFSFADGTSWSLSDIVSRVGPAGMSGFAGPPSDAETQTLHGAQQLIASLAAFGAGGTVEVAPLMGSHAWREGSAYMLSH